MRAGGGGQPRAWMRDRQTVAALGALAVVLGVLAPVVAGAVGVGTDGPAPAADPPHPNPADATTDGNGSTGGADAARAACNSIVIYSEGTTGTYEVVLDVRDRITTRNVSLRQADVLYPPDHPTYGSGVVGVVGYRFDLGGPDVQVAGLVEGNYVNPQYDVDRGQCVSADAVADGRVLATDWENLVGETVGSGPADGGSGAVAGVRSRPAGEAGTRWFAPGEVPFGPVSVLVVLWAGVGLLAHRRLFE